jgi:4-hydroxy-tetrahydrodipicolinate reductase
MKIALIGYGKMGHAIEEIAVSRGHEIVLRVSTKNLEDNTVSNIQKADVAIEFSRPEIAFNNLTQCLDAGVPVVCGTTGWLNRFEEIKKYCAEKKGALLYASNFSIGVNIFFELNKRLAQLMSAQQEYEVSMEEIHHTHKKDSPSGTAISLAEQILDILPVKKKWVNQVPTDPSELGILSRRIDPAPGTHKVMYHSEVDDIEIIHTAHSRKGFALGAVLAAEFLKGKSGVFSMADVLRP